MVKQYVLRPLTLRSLPDYGLVLLCPGEASLEIARCDAGDNIDVSVLLSVMSTRTGKVYEMVGIIVVAVCFSTLFFRRYPKNGSYC